MPVQCQCHPSVFGGLSNREPTSTVTGPVLPEQMAAYELGLSIPRRKLDVPAARQPRHQTREVAVLQVDSQTSHVSLTD